MIYPPLIAAGLLLVTATSAAQEPPNMPPLEELLDEEQRLEVIQNRKYVLDHELAASIGSLPIDPFYKGFTVNASYTWHIWDLLAWEAVSFTYSFNVDTKLKEEVFRVALATGEQAPAFPQIEWAVASRVVFKPLYGKQALFNTKVIHVEAYLMGGPDVLYVQNVPGRRGVPRDRVLAGFDIGAGLRLFLTEVVSFRLDLNEIVYFEPTQVQHALHIRLGASFNLGIDR